MSVTCRRCGSEGHDVPLEGPRGHNCRVALALAKGDRGPAVGLPKAFLPWTAPPTPAPTSPVEQARDRLVVDGYDANYGIVETAPHDMWAIFSPGMQDELRIGTSADVAEVLGVDRPMEVLRAMPGSWVRYRHGIAIKLGQLVGEDPR